MNTITVITAVRPSTSDYLGEAWHSLAEQELPPGWVFEWLVQCDSNDPDDEAFVASRVPDDEHVSFRASRSGGPGIARTLALARARGTLIKVLDADDQLAPGALRRDIEVHEQHEIGWSASRVIDEHPDGTRSDHYPTHPPDGRVEPGTVRAAYAQDWRILVHPATLCVRYDLLLALGGWMALPASEDTGVLLALDAISPGWFHHEIGMIYRRWDPQMSATTEHADPEELAARRYLAATRADILANREACHDLRRT